MMMFGLGASCAFAGPTMVRRFTAKAISKNSVTVLRIEVSPFSW
jgi:hypothetical protein